MIEKTIVLLKVPESDTDSKIISQIICGSLKKTGFKFSKNIVALDERELAMMYGDVDTMILNSIYARIAYKKLQAILVIGENAVEEVFKLKGHKTDPHDCYSESWRCIISKIVAVRYVRLWGRNDKGNPSFVTIVDNFVHAPGPDDVERNLQVFRKYFSQI